MKGVKNVIKTINPQHSMVCFELFIILRSGSVITNKYTVGPEVGF